MIFISGVRMIPGAKLLTIVVLSSLFLTLGLGSCSGQKASPAGFWRVLRPGDTLWKISRRFSVDILALQRANDIYDPADVKAGMKIFIPAKKSFRPVRKIKVPASTGQVRRSRPSKRGESARQTSRKSALSGLYLIWPANGVISSGYGVRHGRKHKGIDITKDGGRKIKAAAGGVVEFAGWRKGFGRTVIIRHGRGVTTLYAHNSKIYARKGLRVKRGSIIAKMGSTGTSSGVHLHFEVLVNGKQVNPLRYLPVR